MSEDEKTIEYLSKKLSRWEDYRLEMDNYEARLERIRKNFVELESYDNAMKLDHQLITTKYMLGRMPSML